VKLGRWLSLFLVLGAVYVLWQIRQVLLLVFSAILLTLPLNRLVNRWRHLGLRRSWAVLLAMFCLFTILLFLALVLVPPFVEQLQQLIGLLVIEAVALQRHLGQWLSQALSRGGDSGEAVWPSLVLPNLQPNLQQVQPWLTWLLNQVYGLFSDVVAILLQVLLVLVLTLMLLANPTAYRQGVIRLFPLFYRARVDQLLTICEARLIAWMQDLFWQMLLVGFVSALGLRLLQVPLALTNAALAGLLEVIPYLGVGLSLVPPLIISGLGTPWKAAAVVGLYLLLQFGKQRLHRPNPHPLPALLLLAQLSFTFFCGFLGLLLAVPIVLMGEVWVRQMLVNDLLKPWWQARHPA
jgi:predicted PurR-regulated permease PerM